jgi:tetratricopeptide (TPR) repeat protein
VFISYAREDADIASRLQQLLLAAGTASVWLDRKSIEGGDDWKREINEGLLRTQVLLAVLTPHAVDPSRRWIAFEHHEADRLLRPIVPLLFADCALPAYLQDIQYVDFRHEWNEGFVALLNALGKITLRAGQDDQKFTDQAPPVGRAFIGREGDLRAVFELIEGEAHQVATGRCSVAIQGMGGTGKTMLAEELVRRLAARYPGGVTVEPRGQRPESAQAVLQRWARCILGDYPQPQWTVLDVRSELQKRYGELLVLIDDVAEKDFEDVSQLLKALPPDATRILTTRSKEVGSLGCLVYELPDFGEEDALLLLRDRLRSKGAAPDEEVLSRLVGLVGGHALSLELVAGRCKDTRDFDEQVEKLARRLADGDVGRIALTVLGARSRKHMSVAVTLEESYEGLQELDAAECVDWARRFRALGVIPDGATLDRTMAAALWGDADPGDDPVVEALDGLFGRAMLNRDAASGLFFVHPLLRAYAHGLVKHEPGELAAVWDRYVGHATAQAAAGFEAPPQEWSRLEPLRPHLLHIASEMAASLGARLGPLAAWSEPSCDRAPVAEATDTGLSRGLAFSLAVRPYVLRRPETGDRGRACLELGLACARATGRERDAVRFLEALGRWHEQRTPPLAERYYESGLALADRCGDRARWATILSHHGELLRKTSRPLQALEVLEKALASHEALRNRRMQATTLKSIGETHWRLGRHELALDVHRRALDIFVSEGDRAAQGDLLNKIGSVRFNQGLHEDAIRLFKEALHIHREVGNRSMEAEDLNDMGISLRYLGDMEGALPCLIDAFMIHRAIGSRRLQAISMCNISSVYIAKGFLEAAFQMTGDALVLARETEDMVTESWALSYRALARQQQGDAAQAETLFRQAIEKSRKVGDRRGEAGHLGHLASLYRETGRLSEALGHVREALDVMRANQLTQAFGGRRVADLETMEADLVPRVVRTAV